MFLNTYVRVSYSGKGTLLVKSIFNGQTTRVMITNAGIG